MPGKRAVWYPKPDQVSTFFNVLFTLQFFFGVVPFHSQKALLEYIQLITFIYRLDGWLSAAADCLELFPDQLIVFAGEQLSQHGGDAFSGEQATTQKRLLFDTIAKFYSGQDKPPLLSGQHLDIHTAILNLLGKY